MNDAEFEQKLAEYLAGEMTTEAAAAFEVEARRNAARAERLDGLANARDALVAGVSAIEHAEHRVADVALSARPGAAPGSPAQSVVRRRIWPAVLRYAAVIALAFGAGFLSRGAGNDAATSNEATGGAGFEQRIVQSYVDSIREHPGASNLSHALLALARR